MEVCLTPDRLLNLLNELGRYRALTEEETDIIEFIVCGTGRGARLKWTPDMDQELWESRRQLGGIGMFAVRHGISAMSAYKRVQRLKAKVVDIEQRISA